MPLDSDSKADIKKFDITPNSGGEAASFAGGVSELSYYEDIMSPTIKLTIAVVDTGNAAPADDGQGQVSASDKIKLTYGEECEIEIEDAKQQKITLTNINIGSRQRISEKKTDVEIYEIVSEENLKNDTVRVTKKYEGKISDSVRKIMEEVIETEKELDIEDTKNQRSFIGTTKKPFWFIYWLASQSIREDTTAVGFSAGYFFYETQSGFKFKSIDAMLDQKAVKKYIYNNSSSMKMPAGYDAKIINFNGNATSDMNDQLLMGSFNSTVNLFNTFESSFGCNPLTIDAQESKSLHAGSEFGQNLNKLFTEAPSRFFTANESIGAFTDIDRSHELDVEKPQILATAASRFNQIFQNKISIVIPADFSLEAGQVVFVDLPEQSTKTNPENSQRMGGAYVISALCHKVSPGKGSGGFQGLTSLELIRDSYGRLPSKASS